jgi:hypothetical protein
MNADSCSSRPPQPFGDGQDFRQVMTLAAIDRLVHHAITLPEARAPPQAR